MIKSEILEIFFELILLMRIKRYNNLLDILIHYKLFSQFNIF